MKKSLQLLAIICFLLAGCSKKEEAKNKDLAKLVIEKNDDGSIKRIGYTLGGEKTGEWRSFVRERLAAVIHYENGAQHGKETWFNKCSGRIIEEGYNDMGSPIGLWYRYMNGELVSVTEYKNDTSDLVYHNPKFQNEGDLPPPPPPDNDDCDEFRDY